jgi:uncharacterized protein YbaA (DUF1428 family)
MTYFDFYVVPVKTAQRAEYEEFAHKIDNLFKRYGAGRIVECWESDVPEGKLTSFPLAVKRAPGESIVVGFVEWPSKQARDQSWEKLQKDPLMQPNSTPMPFDGKRMIFGGFDKIMEV